VISVSRAEQGEAGALLGTLNAAAGSGAIELAAAGGRRRGQAALTRGPASPAAVTLPGMEIMTGSGPARVELDQPPGPAFLLVLTHGSGGGVDSRDLLAARDAGLRRGGAVARVLQPYLVRGARAPGSPDRQDAAWLDVIEALRPGFPAMPLVQGGRSNGARLACRTAAAAGARAVVALAFPLHPPGRPERSRAAELRQAGVPVLVVNGDRDPFGVPDSADASRLVVLPGETHALSRHPQVIRQAVEAWLREVLAPLKKAR
jgi:uncharacterized protein